ncbi:uncharacterized protein RHO25_009010 [Cercospora beticola]|uniref:Uncharacterized protein n=1 Tax=Cercospora beticola TaxID=122368 RepID=A0ABZ0NXQ1_CERBT|nr:hypothetical protein RHO25_009010 [Cercospora beticola]
MPPSRIIQGQSIDAELPVLGPSTQEATDVPRALATHTGDIHKEFVRAYDWAQRLSIGRFYGYLILAQQAVAGPRFGDDYVRLWTHDAALQISNVPLDGFMFRLHPNSASLLIHVSCVPPEAQQERMLFRGIR